MGRKKHLQGISDEEMTIINEKMNNVQYVDGYKTHLRGLGFKLNIKCKNEKQKEFLNNLKDMSKKVNICNAPAGVGKTFLSLYAALFALKTGSINKIIVIVPTVEASEVCKIGLLPGSINEKIEPYKIVMTSTLKKILKESGNEDYDMYAKYLIESKLIEFELLSYARGRNYDNTFLILDESENLSKRECLLLMTRIGDGNSKIVLIGDELQCDRKDLKSKDVSGLIYAEKKLDGLDEVTIDNFTTNDIVRNPFLIKLLKRWNDE